jgi:hypothetical protein
LFSFLGVNHVVEERITDTIIGSVIAFIASYLIFPSWEYQQIREGMRDVIRANISYLSKIADGISGKSVDITEYKLARKDVFVKSGNLSAAFERMTSEPKSKQKNVKEVHKFVVLNHILSSYIATAGADLMNKTAGNSQPDMIKSIKKSLAVLNDTVKKLGGGKMDFTPDKIIHVDSYQKPELLPDDSLLKEQLGFINKISVDIARVADGM